VGGDAALQPNRPEVVRTVRNGPASPRTVVSDLAIAAHGSLTLSPFGDHVVLRDPAPFETSSSVPLTPTFRQGGTVTIDATVTTPGLRDRPAGQGVPERCGGRWSRLAVQKRTRCQVAPASVVRSSRLWPPPNGPPITIAPAVGLT
jgi:hypothetical protein